MNFAYIPHFLNTNGSIPLDSLITKAWRRTNGIHNASILVWIWLQITEKLLVKIRSYGDNLPLVMFCLSHKLLHQLVLASLPIPSMPRGLAQVVVNVSTKTPSNFSIFMSGACEIFVIAKRNQYVCELSINIISIMTCANPVQILICDMDVIPSKVWQWNILRKLKSLKFWIHNGVDRERIIA